MKGNLLMNCLWYEDISPDQLADVLELPSEKLYDKLFRDDDFTPEEIKEIVALLGLTDDEKRVIFG